MVDFFIFLSVLICVITALISAYFIYRRDPKSQEHKFFAIFFLGFAGMVGFYLFLQDPVLKEFSYPLQLVSMSVAVLGLALFYNALSNEGKASNKVIFFCSSILFLIPALSLIFHPYVFIEESYGFELVIDSWFITLVITVYVSFTLYALFGLLWFDVKSTNPAIKQKLRLIYISLFLNLVIAFIFLGYVPIFLSIQYLKPVGYFGLVIGTIVMAYSFRRKYAKKEKGEGEEK